jgi:hypothetical protein
MPLNDKKVADFRKLKQHISEEQKEFCSEIFQCPTAQTVAEDELYMIIMI